MDLADGDTSFSSCLYRKEIILKLEKYLNVIIGNKLNLRRVLEMPLQKYCINGTLIIFLYLLQARLHLEF